MEVETADQNGTLHDSEDVLTADQIGHVLDNDESRLTAANAAYRRRSDGFRSMTDRSKFSTDVGFEAFLKDQQPILEQAERDALGVAETVQRNAQMVRSSLAIADRPRLSDDEQARANILRPEIDIDAAELDVPDLRDAVRAALFGADRAALACWLRAGRRRLAQNDDRGLDRLGAGNARIELTRMLCQIQASLRDATLDPLRQRAFDVLTKAQDLETEAGRRQRATQAYTFLPQGGIPIPGAAVGPIDDEAA